MSELKKHIYASEFQTESGYRFPSLEIAYHTYGEINQEGNNVIWICHALTANSDAADWWSDMVGEGKLFDPAKHFIVCANVIGSCYGSTGPLSINPATTNPWYRKFPIITVRDMVKAHNILRKHLGINRIHTVIGGSIGGFQALEWSIMNENLFDHLILLASSAKASPWAIALNESQRMAIEADSSYFEDSEMSGINGMKAARSIALLSYRNRAAYNFTQAEYEDAKWSNFRAASYQKYQGEKLAKRFNAYSYYALSQSIDSHSVGRNRDIIENVLGKINTKTLIVSIESDILFPVEEQKLMHKHIKNSTHKIIPSIFGHDGFLVEWKQLSEIIIDFYKK